VGAPFFNLTFGPLIVPVLLAMPFGPLLAWKRGDLAAVSQRLIGAAALAVIALVVTVLVQGKPVLAPLGIGLAVFVIAGALTDVAERIGLFRAPGGALRRAAGLPRSAWGAAFAHMGIGLTLIGVIGESQLNSERIVAIKVGDKLALSGYELSFDGVAQRAGANYRELVATFTVRLDGKVIGVMEPAKRTFAHREMSTTEAALKTRGVSQLYLSLGDVNADGAVAVRAYDKPLVLLIWLGALVMAIGGALSLSDRRLRIGAPRPAKARAALQPAE
ncbi:MAG: cytochrome c-type biogenesis CcmF C-terminal domain-containing protein, partial [Rhodoplanes sp.]